MKLNSKYNFMLVFLLLIANSILSDSNWWHGGTSRLNSMGMMTITVPDSSALLDLYSAGYSAGIFSRKKVNIVSLSTAYNDYNNDIGRSFDVNNFDPLNSMIMLWISENDVLIMRPHYDTIHNFNTHGIRLLSGDIAYSKLIDPKTAISVSLGYSECYYSLYGFSDIYYGYPENNIIERLRLNIDITNPLNTGAVNLDEEAGFQTALSLFIDKSINDYYNYSVSSVNLALANKGLINNYILELGAIVSEDIHYSDDISISTYIRLTYRTLAKEHLTVAAKGALFVPGTSLHLSEGNITFGLLYHNEIVQIPFEIFINSSDYGNTLYYEYFINRESEILPSFWYSSGFPAIKTGAEFTVFDNCQIRGGIIISDKLVFTGGLGLNFSSFIINLGLIYVNNESEYTYPGQFYRILSLDLKYIF